MESKRVIFHILPADDWLKAKEFGIYTPATIEAEGFIHCSTKTQVINSANVFFKGQSDLILLMIDAEKVELEIRYEDLVGEGTLFPHIYGQLNLDAVVQAAQLRCGEDGGFIFPATFENE